jgi:hypothetical protein
MTDSPPADTTAGRVFDLVLVAMIVASVTVVVLDSMAAVHARRGGSAFSSSGLAWPSSVRWAAHWPRPGARSSYSWSS